MTFFLRGLFVAGIEEMQSNKLHKKGTFQRSYADLVRLIWAHHLSHLGPAILVPSIEPVPFGPAHPDWAPVMFGPMVVSNFTLSI